MGWIIAIAVYLGASVAMSIVGIRIAKSEHHAKENVAGAWAWPIWLPFAAPLGFIALVVWLTDKAACWAYRTFKDNSP